jgi:tRNA C32,U32 (ribose-2'-O)-methylase TrmJ
MPTPLSTAQVVDRQKKIERYEKLQAMIRRSPAEQQEMEGLQGLVEKEMSRRAMAE